MEGGYCFSWDMSVNFISQKEALKLLVAHSYWSHIWNTEPVSFQSSPGQTKTRYQREDRGAVYLIVKYCMAACLNAISNLIFRLLDTFSDHRGSISTCLYSYHCWCSNGLTRTEAITTVFFIYRICMQLFVCLFLFLDLFAVFDVLFITISVPPAPLQLHLPLEGSEAHFPALESRQRWPVKWCIDVQ